MSTPPIIFFLDYPVVGPSVAQLGLSFPFYIVFFRTSLNCSITQFSDCRYDLSDSGDGVGALIFKWFSILEFGGLLISCFSGFGVLMTF